MLEEVNIAVISMLGIIWESRKSTIKTMEGTNTLVDLDGFSFTFIIL